MKKHSIALVAVTAIAAMSMSTGCTMGIYGQDVGEVSVIRGMGGNIVGSNTEPGFHPVGVFDDVITFSVRNNVISFYGTQDEEYKGGSATGGSVYSNDSSGARCSLDIQINYSIDPTYAEQLYSNYGSQEAFVRSVVVVEARSVTRDTVGKFSTIQMLTDRGTFATSVEEALTAKWSDKGIIIESVSVQDVRYGDAITEKYAEAQAAQIGKSKAEAEQETARIQAETLVIQAQGEADANAVLAASLSPEVLTEHYIQALAELGAGGNVVVVPEGSTPFIKVGE